MNRIAFRVGRVVGYLWYPVLFMLVAVAAWHAAAYFSGVN